MSGYVHWLCFDSSTSCKAGCGIVEAGALVSASIETVTCLQCRYELSRRLGIALGVGDSKWAVGVDWSNANSIRGWVESLWSTNWRLHAEAKELREMLEILTKEKVEWLSGRLMQATVKRHEEEQYAKPDPECAGCKRWTHRIKVLEERVEYARKVLEGR